MTDSRRIFLKSVLLVLLVVLVSCSDDDDPTQPPIPFTPTLESLWPHADGNSWTYHLTTEDCEHSETMFYDNLEDVPPVPTIEELYARLENGIPCDQPVSSSGSLDLFFDGEVAISPGDTVQRLRSSVEADEGWPTTPLGFSGGLWAIRQDRIVAFPDWKNDDWISWVYLTDNLEPGAEFSYQLSPNMVDDLFLYGRIWRHVQHELPDNTSVNCVECFYLLDLGIQQATDPSGQPGKYARSYIYGVILYAEDVGPILLREQREMPFAGVIQDPSENRNTMDSLAFLTGWAAPNPTGKEP